MAVGKGDREGEGEVDDVVGGEKRKKKQRWKRKSHL
jgi:hypothetical protein